MKAVLLDQIPLSGEYSERSYAPTLECDWVLFEPDAAETWIGAFGRGSFGCREAVRVGRTSVFLILATGEAYLVDCESGAHGRELFTLSFDGWRLHSGGVQPDPGER